MTEHIPEVSERGSCDMVKWSLMKGHCVRTRMRNQSHDELPHVASFRELA